jgi:hypothetical protein
MKLPSRRALLGILSLIALLYVGTMILESRKPLLPAVRPRGNHPTGYALVSMLVDLVDAQLEGFGGWTPNDLPLTPGYWLDNLPSFQLGVMSVVRRVTITLRDDLGRGKPTEQPHPELVLAATAYSADLKRWASPSAERMLESGNDALIRFRQGLEPDSATHAQIYPRPEALLRLVEAMAEDLRVVNERLLKASDRDAVPWYKVDDNLYLAQGVAYAQQGLLRAAKTDFPALQHGKAEAALEAALTSLEEGQFEPWVVTNGSKSSLLANHSSRLRTFLEEARLSLVAVAAALRSGG